MDWGEEISCFVIAFVISFLISLLEFILQPKYSHTQSILIKCWLLYLYSAFYGLWSCLLLFLIRVGFISIETIIQATSNDDGSSIQLDYSNPLVVAIAIGLLGKSISKLNIIQIGRYPIGFEALLKAIEDQILKRLRIQIYFQYKCYFTIVIQQEASSLFTSVEDFDSDTGLLKSVAKERLPHILLDDEENQLSTFELEIDALQHSPAVMTYYLNNFGKDHFQEYIRAVIQKSKDSNSSIQTTETNDQ